MNASHFFTRWHPIWPNAAPLFEVVANIVRLSARLTIDIPARYTYIQLSTVMGVNCSDLSVCQLFVILLVSLNLRIVLNSDLVFSGDEDTCDVPWRSFGSSTSCYLLGPHSMTWGEAWQFCFKSGGFMLEIESEEEHSLLTGRNESFSCNINACMMYVWHFSLEKKRTWVS